MSEKTTPVKTIGILTSGGDAPGMNAAVRAVTRAGIASGLKVLGIERGYSGLINKEIVELDLRSVSDIIHKGGTILYSARCPEFKEEAGIQKAIATCKEFGIDGIVVIGGDGSFRGAADLSAHGLPCVGIPGTIDNDIAATTYTIGYDTAMNTVKEMVDRLRDTMESHDRCSVVEIMGRGAGYLALTSGIAVGATAVLIPEVKFDIETDVIDRIREGLKKGKKNFIIAVAEGVQGIKSVELAERIEAETGVETRATILGHVQRGGSPTCLDRIMASWMGVHAVNLLKQGIGNRVVGYNAHSEVVDYDIQEALTMTKPFPYELYEVAKVISI